MHRVATEIDFYLHAVESLESGTTLMVSWISILTHAQARAECLTE